MPVCGRSPEVSIAKNGFPFPTTNCEGQTHYSLMILTQFDLGPHVGWTEKLNVFSDCVLYEEVHPNIGLGW